uniref:Uncharacterized protein n=1 Tax=Moniliophthora roreri TaxID=221103 RepID=A0A0W0FMV4_MONRR
MSITNASRFSIKGQNTLNHVHGDQTIINLNSQLDRVERTEYDEFEYIKRGDIICVKKIMVPEDVRDWHWKWQNGSGVFGRHKTERTICTVELAGRQSSGKYTAIMYEGKDAHELWEEDFQRVSGTRNPDIAQLFGINQSKIPALIFHHELLPLAHVYTGSFWMEVYIGELSQNKRCARSELWMDTKGFMCSGPKGPATKWLSFNSRSAPAVPLIVDMLKDDVSFSYFCNIGSSADWIVLNCARYSWLHNMMISEASRDTKTTHLYEHPAPDPAWTDEILYYVRRLGSHFPRRFPKNIIYGLRFDIVYSNSLEAVAMWPRAAASLWQCVDRFGWTEMTWVDGGLIRFKFTDAVWWPSYGVHLDIEFDESRLFWDGWLSQSSRVFDPLNSSGNGENWFQIKPPSLRIETPKWSRGLRRPKVVREMATVYLFLHPLPMSVSELIIWAELQDTHFWSFDETGQSKLSKAECEQRDLPSLVSRVPGGRSTQLHSWSARVYPALRDWQIARGFDPNTSDWARHMRYPEFEIISARKDEDRFDGVVEDQEENQATGSWWEAFSGSNISAFAF